MRVGCVICDSGVYDCGGWSVISEVECEIGEGVVFDCGG